MSLPAWFLAATKGLQSEKSALIVDEKTYRTQAA